MNPNFIIDSFTEPITALPDTPQLPASELKRRFQAPSDELREAHNALAACVSGITDATYPDTVTENMLSDTVRDKINAKAEQTDLAAETAARTAQDSKMQSQLDSQNESLLKKCEVYFGTYTGNGNYPRTIQLGFTPRAVILGHQNGLIAEPTAVYSALMLLGHGENHFEIVYGGFQLKNTTANRMNYENARFYYIAFK